VPPLFAKLDEKVCSPGAIHGKQRQSGEDEWNARKDGQRTSGHANDQQSVSADLTGEPLRKVSSLVPHLTGLDASHLREEQEIYATHADLTWQPSFYKRAKRNDYQDSRNESDTLIATFARP